MDYRIDLDPAHRVIRLTVTAVVTEELAEECYQSLSFIASRGGPYAAIFDLSGVPVRRCPRCGQGAGGTRSCGPSGKTPRDCGRRAMDIWTGSYVPNMQGFPGRTISRRPIIGGSLRNGWRASRRFHPAYLPQRAGRLNRTSKGVWPCSVVRLHLASD